LDAGPCSATALAGAIPLCNGYLASGVIGKGGYSFTFEDGMGSTACLLRDHLCTAGMTAVASAMTFGAGIGVHLDPAATPFPLPGTGIKYAISSMPQALQISVANSSSGPGFCVQLKSPSGTVRWSDFNTKCYAGNTGTTLTLPFSANEVQFVVPATGTAGTFDFCVETLEFTP
jgi:hypothetical protein